MSSATDGQVGLLIAGQASAHGAKVINWKGDGLVVTLPVELPSGRLISYVLSIDVSRLEPRVAEETPRHLPPACPNRHINPSGTFCMGFPEEDAIEVRTEDDAAAWWRRVMKFLVLQEAARQLRRWPTSREWAHGQEAATHQRAAERSAAGLGQRFVDGLVNRHLEPRRRAGASDFVELRENGVRLYSVWEGPRRVATLRQRCICGSGRTFAKCGDHAHHAAELPLELLSMRFEEARFWNDMSREPCCGTLADCPRARANDAPPPARAA